MGALTLDFGCPIIILPENLKSQAADTEQKMSNGDLIAFAKALDWENCTIFLVYGYDYN